MAVNGGGLSLSQLPLELISNILEYLLVEDRTIDVNGIVSWPPVPHRLYTRGTDFPVLFGKDDYLRQVAAQAWLEVNTFKLHNKRDELQLLHLLKAIPNGFSYLRHLIYRAETPVKEYDTSIVSKF